MIDYTKVGLKVGLECHQQLATREKLFCMCKPELSKGKTEMSFLRRLRPTQSELGQTDSAAFFEFQKGIKILYEGTTETSCLVEMDEEPPHNLNREALEIALTIALMMKMKIVDEIHIMRKVVIDGSNTTGFQRTCVIAINGAIEVEGKQIPIQHISLEEDAARKSWNKGLIVSYKIDRLCVPLIEITTEPVIYSPKEAEKVAFAIGEILRVTRKVKRGLGSIRQDLNISIKDGALIEIKGVQDLGLISKIVEYEVQRQLNLLNIMKELKKRGVKEEDFKKDFFDVTSIFSDTDCHFLQESIKPSKYVLAVKLPKFSGLLGTELIPSLNLGTEIADRARFWGKVNGIIHTDDFSSSGISKNEIRSLRDFLGAEPEDAIVLVVDTKENGVDALKAVIDRALDALKNIPEETRAPNPDGTTRYSRPRPGAARMYPETDVPPINIEQDYIEKLRLILPLMPEQRKEQLINEFGINEKLAKQIQNSHRGDLFEIIVKKTDVPSTIVAATLTETFKSLKRDGIKIDQVTDEKTIGVFKLISSGLTSKESIPEIITWLSRHEDAKPIDALNALGLSMISERELNLIVEETLKKNESFVIQKGANAFSFLMGIIMKKYRGRVKADLVSELLKKKLFKNSTF